MEYRRSPDVTLLPLAVSFCGDAAFFMGLALFPPLPFRRLSLPSGTSPAGQEGSPPPPAPCPLANTHLRRTPCPCAPPAFHPRLVLPRAPGCPSSRSAALSFLRSPCGPHCRLYAASHRKRRETGCPRNAHTNSTTSIFSIKIILERFMHSKGWRGVRIFQVRPFGAPPAFLPPIPQRTAKP